MGLIADSGVFIQAERAGLALSGLVRQIIQRFGPVPVAISVVTIAELMHGIFRAQSPSVAARRKAFLQTIVDEIESYDFATSLATSVGQIEGEQAARGISIDFPDLVIGATALALDYAVLTANPKHFRLIPSLRVESF